MAFKENGMNLEQILGQSITSNYCMSICPISGDIFYSSGCVAVRYSSQDDKQKHFYYATKAISCMRVSFDGGLLALGERGHQPCCQIWDLNTKAQVSSLVGHKNGIGCIAFSPTGAYLVTVGFKHDRQLIIWNLATFDKISTHKLGNKVHGICFNPHESYFVTCGDRHLKFWTLQKSADGSSLVGVTGRPASILEDHKDAIFLDICCGQGDFRGRIYCTTSTGVLCSFNESTMLENWIQIEAQASFCLSLLGSRRGQGFLVVGCSNGVVRVFHPDTLKYLCMLPLPAALSELEERPSFPACYATCGVWTRHQSVTSFPAKLACAYADRSMFVWDISDIFNAKLYRSQVFHRACVWDVCYINDLNYQEELHNQSQTFATCSSDNSIRLWNLDADQQLQSNHSSMYSKTMLSMIELSDHIDAAQVRTNTSRGPRTGGVGNIPMTPDFAARNANRPPLAGAAVASSVSTVASNASGEGGVGSGTSSLLATVGSAANLPTLDLSTGLPDSELPDRPAGVTAPRVLALHPNAHHLTFGDRSGRVNTVDLRSMVLVQAIPAHSAEILTLSFSPLLVKLSDESWIVDVAEESEAQGGKDRLVLLATAGRDRLIHIFDASLRRNGAEFRGFQPLCTLDYHSSSVTVVKFSPDGQRLISCGGDRTMVFSSVQGPIITRLRSIQTPHGTINGLSIEATNKFAVTSGQDKRLHIWNLQSGKHMRAYKNEAVNGELYKVDTDPSGMFIAVCSFDKNISIFDFFSGDLVAQATGHSELITNIKFSPDGKRLISIGGDGCIFVWKLAKSLVVAMQDRLVELYSSAQRRQIKLSRQIDGAVTSSTNVMPQPGANISSSHSDGENFMPPPPPPAMAVKLAPRTAASAAIKRDPSTPIRGLTIASAQSKDRTESDDSAALGLEVIGRGKKLGAKKSGTITIESNIISSIDSSSTDPAAEPRESTVNGGGVGRIVMSGQNKWAARASQDGYEIFGKKINPAGVADSSNRNQFTVELSSTSLNDELPVQPTGNDVDGIDWALGIDGTDTELAGTTRLASDHEALDNVNLVVSDDEGDYDDDDGDKLFKPQQPDTDRMESIPTNGSSTFVSGSEAEDIAADDDVLERTSSNIESLERSAENLENWLENMIRNEGHLENNIPDSASEINRAADTKTGPALNSSLSSAFFQTLRPNADPSGAVISAQPGTRSSTEVFHDDDSLDLPPPPGKMVAVVADREIDESVDTNASMSGIASISSGRELKRRETVAAVNQMKERLRGMGLLRTPQGQALSSTSAVDTESASLSLSEAISVDETPDIQEAAQIDKLREQTEHCRRIIQEFSSLRQSAMDSFDALLAMRSSVTLASSSQDHLRADGGELLAVSLSQGLNISQHAVLADADFVIGDFQEVVSSLASTLRQQASIRVGTSFSSIPSRSANKVIVDSSNTFRGNEDGMRQRHTSASLAMNTVPVASSVDSVPIFSADQSTIQPVDQSMSSLGFAEKRILAGTLGLGAVGESQDERALAALLDRFSDMVSDKITRKLEASMSMSMSSSTR